MPGEITPRFKAGEIAIPTREASLRPWELGIAAFGSGFVVSLIGLFATAQALWLAPLAGTLALAFVCLNRRSHTRSANNRNWRTAPSRVEWELTSRNPAEGLLTVGCATATERRCPSGLHSIATPCFCTGNVIRLVFQAPGDPLVSDFAEVPVNGLRYEESGGGPTRVRFPEAVRSSSDRPIQWGQTAIIVMKNAPVHLGDRYAFIDHPA